MDESHVLRPKNNEAGSGILRLQSPKLALNHQQYSARATCDLRSDGFNSSIGSSYTPLEQEEMKCQEPSPIGSSTFQDDNEWKVMWNQVRKFSKYPLPSESDLDTKGVCGDGQRKRVAGARTVSPVDASWIWEKHPQRSDLDDMQRWSRNYSDYMRSPYVPANAVLVFTSKQMRQKLYSVAKCKAWLDAHHYWMQQK